jgi:hypothetical protein
VLFDELEELCAEIEEAAEQLGVDVEIEDRIGDQYGLINLDIWRADVEKPDLKGEAGPPRPG